MSSITPNRISTKKEIHVNLDNTEYYTIRNQGFGSYVYIKGVSTHVYIPVQESLEEIARLTRDLKQSSFLIKTVLNH